MALCSPPPSVYAYKSPSSLSPPSPPSLPSSPYTRQCPSASHLRLSLIVRRGILCSPLRISAFHTRPDTSSTLYHVLHVPQTATLSEIKAAYRRLARLYHPDACHSVAVDEDYVDDNDDATARTHLFLQIHSAYATLSDAQTRARYDLQLSAQAMRDRIRSVGSPLSAGNNNHLAAKASAAFSSYRVGRNWETDQCWC